MSTDTLPLYRIVFCCNLWTFSFFDVGYHGNKTVHSSPPPRPPFPSRHVNSRVSGRREVEISPLGLGQKNAIETSQIATLSENSVHFSNLWFPSTIKIQTCYITLQLLFTCNLPSTVYTLLFFLYISNTADSIFRAWRNKQGEKENEPLVIR